MAHDVTRRRIFRTTLGGAAATVCLPILDMTLNGNGEAFAATGAPLPVRFGTWHWGCGMNPARWVPKATGADWEVTPELAAIAQHRKDFTLLSGYTAMLDGRPNEPHVSAVWALRTGCAPRSRADLPDPSFDNLIARAIGGGVRFRSLDMAATGGKVDSYSTPGGGAITTPEPTAVSLYQRVFGAGFQDPNAANFTPDPNIQLRHSVLSRFSDERATLMREVGASDRDKLDAYFTSVRELENKLALELEKPAPAEHCAAPSAMPAQYTASTEIEAVVANHKLMVDMLVMALQCHQTKVFNMVFSPSASTLRKAGQGETHHTLTHNEAVDEKLGYQPESTWYSQRSIQALGYMIEKIGGVREGGKSLLDNMLIYAHSDTSDAKLHALDEMPVIMIGRAGGRVKTGLHLREQGAPVTKTALTAMRAVGLGASSFGKDSMAATQIISGMMT